MGSVKEPSLAEILALNPDFVILSADTAGHGRLHAPEPPPLSGTSLSYSRNFSLLSKQICKNGCWNPSSMVH
mgnify:CR=1 FL=1